MKNCLIRSEYAGNIQTLSRTFDEKEGVFYRDWGFFGIDNPNIYFTEKEAIEIAKSYSGQSSRKNIEVIQPLANNEYYLIDYKSDEIKYFLKKAPT